MVRKVNRRMWRVRSFMLFLSGRAMHAIIVSVADEMRGGITDPSGMAYFYFREVNEHATASKRQCL